MSTETLEIKITCPLERAPYLQELLWTVNGVDAVMEDYGTTDPGLENLVRKAEDTVQSVRVFSQDTAVEERVAALLAQQAELADCRIAGVRTLREENWAESWKAFWHITPITGKLTICPTWEREAYRPKSSGEQVIWLDPGCAFGTGAHETTRLMLEGMARLAEALDFSRISVLDVGTGSGVLAVYAAKLGCRTVLGVDNDPVAVRQAEENLALNGVEHAVTMSDTPLGELCQTRYDVVLANIIAPVILELLPDMCLRLEKGGVLLASGLIERTVGQVEAAMAAQGFSEFERRQQGDWLSLLGRYTGL